MIKNVK